MNHSRLVTRSVFEWAVRAAFLPIALFFVVEPVAAQQSDSTKMFTFQPGTMQLAGHRLSVDVGALRVPEVRGGAPSRTRNNFV